MPAGSTGVHSARLLSLLDAISGGEQGGGDVPQVSSTEIAQGTRHGHPAFDAAVGVLRSVGLNGDVEAADAGDGAETAASCPVRSLNPRTYVDRIGRRRHVSMKRLREVVNRPSAGEPEVLLGTDEDAAHRIPLEPLEVIDLNRRELISDVMPCRHTAIVSRASDNSCLQPGEGA